MKEKFKSYYHKFINYLKSNWVKVLCIFIVVVYFVCGLVSFYKNGSSSDDPLKNDTSIPITSTYKVINKKELVSEDGDLIGGNLFNTNQLVIPEGSHLTIDEFNLNSFHVLSDIHQEFYFDIPFVGISHKLINLVWDNQFEFNISFKLGETIVYEINDQENNGSFTFSFSSDNLPTVDTPLRCVIIPNYVETPAYNDSYWAITILDITDYYTNANDNGFNNGYNDGVSDGFADGHDAGYQAGYDEGELVGAQHGYDEGYNQGKKEGKQEGLTEGEQKGYQNGFNAGKTEGLHEGERKGYNDGLTAGREAGYKNGYDEGYSAGSSVVQVKDVFIDILEAPFNILKNSFNFEILGINFSSILVGVVSILLVGFVIRKII